MKSRLPGLLFFLILSLFFQLQRGEAGARDADLEKLIVGLQTHYGKMKGLSADFVQIYRDRAGRQLREEGTLIIKRPGKMRWEYRRPEEKLFLTDGKKVYFYIPSERQVTVQPIKETEDPRAPFLFLLGRPDLRKDFKKIEISNNESPIEAGDVVLELTPKNNNAVYKTAYAEVDPNRLQLRRLTVIDPAGARSDFLLSNFKENYIAVDDLFKFDPPPGIRVLN